MYRLARLLASNLMLLAAVIAFAIPACAQGGSTTASVTATAADEKRGIIAGVIVKAKNIGTNLTREATTDEEGNYLLAQLPPVSYELVVTLEGFTTQTSKLDLVLGTTSRFNFTMVIGATSDIVEVTTTN